MINIEELSVFELHNLLLDAANKKGADILDVIQRSLKVYTVEGKLYTLRETTTEDIEKFKSTVLAGLPAGDGNV